MDAEMVEGRFDPAFSRVAETFAEGFRRHGERGAAVCVSVGGRVVVDLWGGVADHRDGRPWRQETIVPVFSASKGPAALCVHVLTRRGRIDLDAPVARVWPEFAAAGKQEITARELLGHRAGLAALEERRDADAVHDPIGLAADLAAQEPEWDPKSAHGYHALTFGWLLAEIVRRVDGRSVGTFLREEIAGPLGLDFWIGLPAEHEARVARIRMAPLPKQPTPVMRAMGDARSLTARAFANPPALLRASQINSPEIHRAEIPAANGIGNARALEGLYRVLARSGRSDGAERVDRESVHEMARTVSRGDDLVLLVPTHFSAGFMKSIDNRPADSARLGPNPNAFGHVGAGGSLGMADPDAEVAVGYVMNQLGPGVMLNERGQSLIDAVYDCLG